MFALRNIGSAEAVDALADGFRDDSALFKFVASFLAQSLFILSIASGMKSRLSSDNFSQLTPFPPYFVFCKTVANLTWFDMKLPKL